MESPATRILLKKMERGDYEHLVVASSIIRLPSRFPMYHADSVRMKKCGCVVLIFEKANAMAPHILLTFFSSRRNPLMLCATFWKAPDQILSGKLSKGSLDISLGLMLWDCPIVPFGSHENEYAVLYERPDTLYHEKEY